MVRCSTTWRFAVYRREQRLDVWRCHFLFHTKLKEINDEDLDDYENLLREVLLEYFPTFKLVDPAKPYHLFFYVTLADGLLLKFALELYR